MSGRVVPEPPASGYQFRLVETLDGTIGPVYSLAWSPDGTMLATAGHGNLTVWDTSTWSVRTVLRGHTSYIWGVTWSPDGETLASGSADGTVRLWRIADSTEIGTVAIGWTMCVAWSPDGSLLASAGRAGRFQIWNAASLTLVREWSVGSWVIAARWSADGDSIVVGDLSGRVSLYDASTAQLLQRFETPALSNDANGVTWSPDDRLVVSAHQDGSTWFWDIATAEAVRTLDPHGGWARGVVYSPDGRLLVTTGEDARANVWATDSWERLGRLPCPPQALWSVSWAPDGRHLAVGAGTYDTTAPSTIFIWEVSGGPEGD